MNSNNPFPRNADIGILASYGFPDTMIQHWINEGIRSLLPIQLEAIQRHKLFDGGNLVVSAPTSSGKTLIGELAAIRAAIDHRKTLYLVPLKALAEEKYRSFRKQCEPNGLKIAISTRDRKDYDRDLANGEFDIAVVVYEKFFPLITSSEQFINQFKLVVVDEMQMLADPNRGGLLELILAWLKSLHNGPQIVGLSAVIGNGGEIPRWLDASFLESPKRPVELRMGYLFNGVFTYWDSNTGVTGEEQWFENTQGTWAENVIAAATQRAKVGEQSLVFIRDKSGTRRMAEMIANVMDDDPAEEAIADLSTAEETQSRNELLAFLERGVAYHNADLTPFERDVIEQHYRSGHIRILVSTTTLAMGVNLPAKNVFLDRERWRSENGIRPYLKSLTKGEFSNMGGRAGRFGLNDDFGRAIVIAENPLHTVQFANCFIHADLEDLEPRLWRTKDLSTAILQSLVIEGGNDIGSLREFLRGTLSWRLEAKSEAEIQKLEYAFTHGLERCVRLGLIKLMPGEKLKITDLGNKVVGTGISVPTAEILIAWLTERGEAKLEILEALFVVCITEDGHSDGISLPTAEYRNRGGHYRNLVIEEIGEEKYRFIIDQLETHADPYDEAKSCKTTLALFDFISDFDNRELEREYGVYLGAISRMAEQVGWVLEAMAGLATIIPSRKLNHDELQRLAARVSHGVPKDGLFLAKMAIPGLGRERIRALVRFGVNSVGGLKEVNQTDLEKMVTKPVAAKIVVWLGQRKAIAVPIESKAIPAATDKPTAITPPLLTLVGETERRNSSIEYSGQRMMVPDRDFELLIRLARARMDSPDGWVSKFDLNLPDGGITQGVSRLRKVLGQRIATDLQESSIIESDYSGSYRLCMEPEQVSFDMDMLRNHWSGTVKELCGLE